ncbi:MAG: hypothetical protein ABJD07_09080, partial [Gemmatimonadaceae bacterium]
MAARRRAAGGLAAFACAIAGAATVVSCVDVGTDPKVPASIEFNLPQLPSLIVGDTLRDSTGAPVVLTATLFNSANVAIPGAPVTFVQLNDTGGIGRVNPTTGGVKGLKPGPITVVADGGRIESQVVTLWVTYAPDSVFATDSVRAVVVAALTPLRVTVLGDTSPAQAGRQPGPIANYRVSFEITRPAGTSAADTTKPQLVDDNGRASNVDTTDASGIASRSIRLSVPAFSSIADGDSVMVRAHVFKPTGNNVNPLRQ